MTNRARRGAAHPGIDTASDPTPSTKVQTYHTWHDKLKIPHDAGNVIACLSDLEQLRTTLATAPARRHGQRHGG